MSVADFRLPDSGSKPDSSFVLSRVSQLPIADKSLINRISTNAYRQFGFHFLRERALSTWAKYIIPLACRQKIEKLLEIHRNVE